ncbi:MAG: hypothetical protein OHK0038_12250 [Flammeovirgaceae bacterium]
MKKLFSFVLLGLLGIWSVSCDDDDDNATPAPTEQQKQEYVEFILEEQLLLQEIGDLSLLFSDLVFNPGERITECGEITYNITNNSGTITVDYGSAGCTDEDGQVLKGKIIYSYTLTNSNTSNAKLNSTITFNNYSMDGNTIEGKIENELFYVTINSTTKITNLKVKSAEGKNLTINSSTQIFKQTAGMNTIDDETDDEFTFNITTNGVGTNGIAYTTKTTKDLLMKNACIFTENTNVAVSGTIEIKPVNYPTYTIDYGNGVCDNKITIQIGNAAPVEYTLDE